MTTIRKLGPSTPIASVHTTASSTSDAARIRSLLATRGDLSPAVREVFAKAPLATVVDAVTKIPRGNHAGASTADRAARLPAHEHEALARRMGVAGPTGGIRRTANKLTLGVLTPEAARLLCSSRGIK